MMALRLEVFKCVCKAKEEVDRERESRARDALRKDRGSYINRGAPIKLM